MSKLDKPENQLILKIGKALFEEVQRHPDDYFAVLASHLHTPSFFGKCIRWWERDPRSHSKTTYIHKATGLPYVDIHALEGWGVIASAPDAFVLDSTVCEYRIVRDAPSTQELLKKQVKKLGKDYQKPRGFVTKSREDDPNKWFCSESADDDFDLQNCRSVFVSPAWAARSDKVRTIYGWLTEDGFKLNKATDNSGAA